MEFSGLFNDPFDVPREVMPGINEINLAKL